MTEIVLSAAIGYGLGQLSPAALISKMKNKDLRENGTGNLGATNTMLVFGKAYGIAVMIFDVLKAYFAIKIAKYMFPRYVFAGLIAGCFAVVGHIFPAYMNFRGGKGVATFAGMILAYDIRVLLTLLLIAIVIMTMTDFGPHGPISAAVLFPIWLWVKLKSIFVFGGVAAVGGLIIYKHRENFTKAKEGTEIRVREFAEKCEEFQTEDEYSVEDQFLEKQ
ncbi:MAG: glycerol-3-phosphate acyltransferase [Lachnospiraceae bacterium]|nr:glycerol-3-phosphate acyltransferase [Lachnospiraceae bacterium]